MTVADFFSTAQAYASAAAEGEHHGPSINDIWFPVVNFIIYAFIIVKFALPLIRDFLKTRREEVVAKIAQASKSGRWAMSVRHFRNDRFRSSPFICFVASLDCSQQPPRRQAWEYQR